MAGRADLRAVASESLHVTLVFLGSQPEEEIGAIAAEASAGLAGLSAARLEPRGLVGVPSRRPRLFALDLADIGGRAAAVQRAAGSALAAAGRWSPERRAFWPHVTLVRARGGTRVGPLAPGGAPDPETFTAREVSLYRSHLQPRGARYEMIERIVLSA